MCHPFVVGVDYQLGGADSLEYTNRCLDLENKEFELIITYCMAPVAEEHLGWLMASNCTATHHG